MDKNAIDLKLDTLFAEWRRRMADDGYKYFTEDGILYKNELSKQNTLALWGESQKRVVFYLRIRIKVIKLNGMRILDIGLLAKVLIIKETENYALHSSRILDICFGDFVRLIMSVIGGITR